MEDLPPKNVFFRAFRVGGMGDLGGDLIWAWKKSFFIYKKLFAGKILSLYIVVSVFIGVGSPWGAIGAM